jgi:peptidoglycan biosynthesis protein MviN/MurJ (putative lipid II flippase)
MQQLLNAMNAVDRPDVAFWTNIIFLGSNVVLNTILIWYIGWVGAAIASALSTVIGLVLIYTLFRRIMTVQIPVSDIGHQVGAALCMGAVIWGVELLIEEFGLVQHNFVIVFGLVTLGAGTYITLLLLLSENFRQIVRRNLPMNQGKRMFQVWK